MSDSTFKPFAESSDLDAAAAEFLAAEFLDSEAMWAADAKAVGLAAVPW